MADTRIERRCSCGNPLRHSLDDCGCIECGRSCCPACGVALESVLYCARCAAALLGPDAADRLPRAKRTRGAGLPWGLAALVAGVLLGAAAAWAGAPTDQLKTSIDQVVEILQDPNLKPESKTAERRASIRKVADGMFDFQETAKRALGPH